MDQERELELHRQVQVLLKNNIIEKSNDNYYSHAFLVPKPNGKWRFVLDFKNLNKATTNHYDWPIPNIRDMLYRIGKQQPNFFAVFDLTSGYYQLPIEEASRSYTAFMTHMGVYRWKRLPMGLTGAGSFFQQCLVTEVLGSLLVEQCELYMDDCIVHAQTADQYVKRLRGVFQRFRDSGISLNPSKCTLGLNQVEYVGHTISKDGTHFTRDKLDSVVNFPRPETKRQMKSFLGLANYFRDHIRNHSMIVMPLQRLVDNYSRSKSAHIKIKWNDECEEAFSNIKGAIDNCPLLWFLDNTSPICLATDASDYGIGAYLYQVVTSKDENSGEVITTEHPIAFVSKSIRTSHAYWDVPTKEGYAIFYALKKWEYLLRDKRFTIYTDHTNLWFMCFQEFDIYWKHIEGQ